MADRWRRGNIFLLGDAAHLTPPFIGQGMGAGLRDAMNLAWKLAGVIAGDLPTAALDSYEQERKPHTRHMIRLALTVGWAMTGGGEFGNLIRRVVVTRMKFVPGMRNKVIDSRTPALHRSAFVTQTARTTAAGRNAVPQSGARRRTPTRQHPRRRLRARHHRATQRHAALSTPGARRRYPYRRSRRRTRRLASPYPRHVGDRPAGPHGHVGRPRHAQDPRPAADLQAREKDSIECLERDRARAQRASMTDLPKRSIVSSTCARLSPGNPTCTHVTPTAASFSRPAR